MTDLRPLNIDTEWVRVSTTAVDWASEDARDLVGWYEQILLIRRFEEAILELANQGLVHGPAHASIGQEAGAVGALSVVGTEGSDQRHAPGPPSDTGEAPQQPDTGLLQSAVGSVLGGDGRHGNAPDGGNHGA